MNNRYNLRKRNSLEDVYTLNKKQKTVESSFDQTEINDPESDSDSDSFINDEDEYYDSLINNIYQELKGYKIPKELFAGIMKSNILKLVDVISEENDKNQWKKGLSDEEIKVLEPKLIELQKNLKNENPSIVKILSANITEEDKKSCLQLFDVMNSYEIGSQDFYNTRSTLVQLLKSENQTEKDIEDLENFENSMKNVVLDGKSFKTKIFELKTTNEIKSIIYSKYIKLEKMSIMDSEFTGLKNQIEWSLSLPYDKSMTPQQFKNQDITNYMLETKMRLNKELDCLESVKNQLLLLLNDSFTSNNSKKAIALCGPPGTGKTSIAKAFAIAIGLPYYVVSMGGVKDSSFLQGNSDVWVGSSPGIIVKALKDMKCNNGIIIFDEVDKLGNTHEGIETQYSLLHISDFTQNNAFRDKYLIDIPIDLSNMWFFYLMNNTDSLDSAFKNRLPIINIPDYVFDEKINIAKNYIIPKELNVSGLDSNDVIFTTEAVQYIVHLQKSGNDGMRLIQNIIKNIISKIKFKKIHGKEAQHIFPNQYFEFELPLKINSAILLKLIDSKSDKFEYLSMYS